MPPLTPQPEAVVAHQRRDDGHEVVVMLDAPQRAELSRLIGRDLTHIRIGVQDLADIGDLVAN